MDLDSLLPRKKDGRSFKKRNGLLFLAALVVSKCLRSVQLYTVFDLLHSRDFPVMLLTFLLLAGAAMIFLPVQQPWKESSNSDRKVRLTPSKWMRVGAYSLLHALSLALWCIGLKYYGPVRTILSSDYADLASVYVMGLFFNRKGLKANKYQGAVVLVAAYLLLFFATSGATTTTEQLIQQQPKNLPNVDAFVSPGQRLANAAPHSFRFLFISIPESWIGGIALTAAISLSAFRKKMTRRLGADVGGAKRLHSLSITIGAAIMAPAALYQFVTSPALESFGFSVSFFVSLFLSVLFMLVVDYYLETISYQNADTSYVVSTSLSASFLFAVLLEWYWHVALVTTWVHFLCYFLILYGLHLMFRSQQQTPNQIAVSPEEILPLYSAKGDGGILNPYAAPHGVVVGGTGVSHYAVGTPWSSVAMYFLREILDNRDSRRILLFLLVNFCFMGVEMLYGMWTNSLSLISDGFHMLFDCTGLGIGLIASVIARWQRNSAYSYGYGRVEILSGFINGVFLVFIAFFVLMEALERFLDPPEIAGRMQLLVVSVLGFAVNLFGMFAFSHGHSHGGGGGHGHSHGHAHGGEKKKKKDKEHGHGHSHKQKHHGGHDHDDHGHGHGHGHDEDDHGHGHGHGKKKEKKEKKHDKDSERTANKIMTGVYLHILADTLGSVGVIISSLLIVWKDWTISDPISSGIISLLVFISTIPLLSDSAAVLLQRSPDELDHFLKKATAKAAALPGVRATRDAHFWSHGSSNAVGTLHVLVDPNVDEQKMLKQILHIFEKVPNMTVEIEKESTAVATVPPAFGGGFSGIGMSM